MSDTRNKRTQSLLLQRNYLTLVIGISFVAFMALTSFTIRTKFLSSHHLRYVARTLYSRDALFQPCTTVMLGIFSMTSDTEALRRQMIRSTYLQNDLEKGDRICSMSMAMDRIKQNGPRNHGCWVIYTFVIGAGDKTRPTDHNDNEPLLIDPFYIENSEEDVTYLNIVENMEDGKSPTYFKFGASIAKEFGIDYIAKTDSDSLLSTDLFLDFIDINLPPAPFNKRMYGGVLWGNPERNLVYAAGQFYYMSVDLADYVGNTLTADDRKKLMSKRRPTEDMDMGTFVFSHPKTVKFMNLSYYVFWSHPLKEKDEWMKEANRGYKKNPGRANYVPFFALCPPAGFTEEKN